ncbi:MAG: 4-hydroxy-tetrahydrodipicolinate reductase [Alistipes sp.]|jgi:4-hydroxy-tetrahydrodipicolinate reductase|nr:4-hydroxy-tetrahydrodipicolinate reductase [Alistipes sp.]
MKVAIIGYGKMGREIERLLIERGHQPALIIDMDNTADLCAERMAGIDVAIEFTTPDTALGNIKKCLETGIPLVCGTTGWTEHMPEIEQLCRQNNGAFFYASNYSIGVNVVFELNRRLAEMMNRFPEYDASIEETHHTQKKDAPSGTAITLAGGIVAALDRKNSWTLGVPAVGTVDPAALEITSVRRSVAPGTHTVTYESPVDTITLRHDMKSRTGLAAGAVSAAEFLAAEVAASRRGIYTMKDLLKL